MSKRSLMCACFIFGVAAYEVMPEGPWYREVTAFGLAGLSFGYADRLRRMLGW